MNSSALASIAFAVLAAFSTGALAQRHDSPGTVHGRVQVSGTGVIASINPASKKVTLEHQTIHKFKLEAATHEFEVKGVKNLDSLKEGDKVNFRLQNSGQDLVVVQISKTK
jgi:Cu/Ag efflux protein CusF